MNQVPACPTPADAQAVAPSPGEPERYHALDAVRAFALLLGIVFHAAESFEPGVASYWAVGDRSPSEFLSFFRHACHSFRLELFFLIAGFFAHLLYHRRGPWGFVRNRASRILVPLVVGWAVLYPLLVYLWLLGASLQGRLAEFGVPAEVAHLPIWQLTLGFFLKLQFLKKFDLTHLWFLHQLLVLYALVLLLRAGWRGVCDRRGLWAGRVDRTLAAVCRAPGRVALLALPTIPMLMWMDAWGVDTPKASLLPHLPTTLLFGYIFGLGWLLHRQPALLEPLGRNWAGHLALGALLVVPTRVGGRWLVALGVDPGAAPWVRWAHAALYALMMWAFVLGFLGMFVRLRRTPSPAWRYIADSSYWLYLVHLPLVVRLQILVAPVALPWMVKYPFVNLVVFPLLFLSYHCLVRSTFIGVQLNGRKYPFRWPWRTPRGNTGSQGRG